MWFLEDKCAFRDLAPLIFNSKHKVSIYDYDLLVDLSTKLAQFMLGAGVGFIILFFDTLNKIPEAIL